MSSLLFAAFETCRKIHQDYGKSYYFATRLLPKDLRLATHALYAFFRVPDEMVDTYQGKSTDQAAQELEDWTNAWYEAHVSGQAQHPVLQAAAYVFHKYKIPFAYSEAFLAAMKQDLYKTRYETYQELREYMYGSAAVVGLMMTHVIGFSSPDALKYAEKLGYAMQLTNFLRDIREDLQERGRIYLPQDELKRFELSEDDLRTGRMSERFKSFMHFQIERADRLYDEANQGITFLSRRGRFAVKVASNLYRMILRKIEEQGYDVFGKRVSTSTWEKIWCVLRRGVTARPRL